MALNNTVAAVVFGPFYATTKPRIDKITPQCLYCAHESIFYLLRRDIDFHSINFETVVNNMCKVTTS